MNAFLVSYSRQAFKYTYWQNDDDDMWPGYLEEYPDYMTQGETSADRRFYLANCIG